MTVPTPFLEGFAAGIMLGITLSVLRFRAKLKFYKHFIEDRLSSIDLMRPSAALKGNSILKSAGWRSNELCPDIRTKNYLRPGAPTAISEEPS